MKYLPCRNCKGGQPALATNAGILHSASRLSTPAITYLCRRCGRTTRLTAAEFNVLPSMTPDQIAASTCDLTPPTPDS